MHSEDKNLTPAALIQCKRCIYDEKIPYITFDEAGICSYCRQHELLDQEYPTGSDGQRLLENLASTIKASGKGKRYDVVVGVSGGTDSSYLLYLAKQLGLRPLAAHFDNTWNSKIAVENIQNVLGALNVDLFTHVVDNKEFCDIFRSFLTASVPDIDSPSDIGLATTHYLAARAHGIQYIFEGHSFRTEGISPHGWFYMDAKYIQSVHDQYGSMKRKTFPNLDLPRWLTWTALYGIKKIRPLYLIDYNKNATKEFLKKELNWQWYGGHHMENRTAYFTNNYYLPRKFHIDLRLCEYSALIRSNQMSKEEALRLFSEPKPFDEQILVEIKKRLQLSDKEFEAIMNAPKHSYRDYSTYKRTFERLRPLFWLLYKLDRVPKSFYLKFTKRYDQERL